MSRYRDELGTTADFSGVVVCPRNNLTLLSILFAIARFDPDIKNGRGKLFLTKEDVK